MTETSTLTMRAKTVRWARRRWPKILIDSALLVAFLAEFVTREGPNYDVHSWIGIILIPIIGLHLTGSIGWIKRVWSRKRQDPDFGLGVLNSALGALAAICILSGFPLWLEWSTAGAIVGVHTVTGFASILVMFVHLWRNRSHLTRLIRL